MVNKPELKESLKGYPLEVGIQYQGPPSMNGLLVGASMERGMEGVILVGEVPFYLARLPQPLSVAYC